MSAETAFEGAGQKVGLEIWKMEAHFESNNLKAVPQDKAKYGEFYSGDAYIVLSTTKEKTSPDFKWIIHFWLGVKATMPVTVAAAANSVELDEILGGGIEQRRETQEHESRLFMSYFTSGVKYLEGGTACSVQKNRLMLVKGKKHIRVTQVKPHVDSLNTGDAFILDDGLILYVWVGPKCSQIERNAATEMATRLNQDEKEGTALIKTIDHGQNMAMDNVFFEALGSSGPITDAKEAEDDLMFEQDETMRTRLLRISDESGILEMKEIASNPLKQEDLDSKDCFVLDTGCSGIYIWIGKQCTNDEKNKAWSDAEAFLVKGAYADWTPITMIVEGAETPLFKQYFSDWVEPISLIGLCRGKKKLIAGHDSDRFDFTRCEIEEFLPDDGSGTVEIWRVENKNLISQPKKTSGTFYTGDCYVVMYTYKQNEKDKHIIYCWQGAKSAEDKREVAANLTQILDEKQLGGYALQIHLEQGNESEHFLRIFHGKMIILLGGMNSKEPESKIRVFQVRGTNSVNTKTAQVIPRAASLNSNDIFIIDTDKGFILWYGKGSSKEERVMAMNVLSHLSPNSVTADVKEIDEGEETEQFWSILGGKENYATGKRLKSNASGMPVRLFHCSNSTGLFSVEEIVNFNQRHMKEKDVMMLDTIDEVYIWIGKETNITERRTSLFTAMKYFKRDPLGRTLKDTAIIQINQGLEPLSFTGHFLAWDPDKWSGGKTYDELKQELGPDKVAAISVQDTFANLDKKHPYTELIKPIPPQGVHPDFKEFYLSDDEFCALFNMTRSEFESLQGWEQAQKKEKLQLI